MSGRQDRRHAGIISANNTLAAAGVQPMSNGHGNAGPANRIYRTARIVFCATAIGSVTLTFLPTSALDAASAISGPATPWRVMIFTITFLTLVMSLGVVPRAIRAHGLRVTHRIALAGAKSTSRFDEDREGGTRDLTTLGHVASEETNHIRHAIGVLLYATPIVSGLLVVGIGYLEQHAVLPFQQAVWGSALLVVIAAAVVGYAIKAGKGVTTTSQTRKSLNHFSSLGHQSYVEHEDLIVSIARGKRA